jgi:hypothetical protein
MKLPILQCGEARYTELSTESRKLLTDVGQQTSDQLRHDAVGSRDYIAYDAQRPIVRSYVIHPRNQHNETWMRRKRPGLAFPGSPNRLILVSEASVDTPVMPLPAKLRQYKMLQTPRPNRSSIARVCLQHVERPKANEGLSYGRLPVSFNYYTYFGKNIDATIKNKTLFSNVHIHPEYEVWPQRLALTLLAAQALNHSAGTALKSWDLENIYEAWEESYPEAVPARMPDEHPAIPFITTLH